MCVCSHHNFHLLSDMLAVLGVHKAELLGGALRGVQTLELSVADFLQTMKQPLGYNCHVTPPHGMKNVTKSCKLQFVPLCDTVRQLLGVSTEPMDA